MPKSPTAVFSKALGALAEHNDTLEHVLDHISFMRVRAISASFPMTPARVSFGILPHEPIDSRALGIHAEVVSR
jgi:hypothetical protein